MGQRFLLASMRRDGAVFASFYSGKRILDSCCHFQNTGHWNDKRGYLRDFDLSLQRQYYSIETRFWSTQLSPCICLFKSIKRPSIRSRIGVAMHSSRPNLPASVCRSRRNYSTAALADVFFLEWIAYTH